MASTQKKKPAARSRTGTNTRTKTNNKSRSNSKSNANVAQAKPKYIPTEKEIKLRNEIKLLITLTVTILLFISNFGLLPPLGDYISAFMFGVFGIIAYILPIVIFISAAFLISNINNRKAIIKFIAGVIFAIFLCCFLQLLSDSDLSLKTLTDIYRVSAKEKIGGGIVGGMFAKALINTISVAGAYIVDILVMIIAMVVITERSFIGGVQKSSKKVYETAAQDVSKIRETAERRQQDKEFMANQRAKKVVKGVAVGVRIEDPDKESDEMHEITEDFPHSNIYRGHVEIDDDNEFNNIEADESYNTVAVESKRTEYVRTQTGVKEPDIVKNNRIELDNLEEDGELFTPKEKIEVSEAALNQMNRKAFATGGTAIHKASSGNEPTSNTPVFEGIPEEQTVNTITPKVSIKKSINKEFVLPSTSLLAKSTIKKKNGADSELRATAANLQRILDDFGVKVTVNNFSKGPSVTRYELQPETGTKVSRITSLSDDIKLNLAAADIRIEAPIPGKAAVGIEVPNATRESVMLRDLIESEELRNNKSKLAFAAGKDIAGKVVVADIAKMPHMLIAGTTGSGKSVFTNSIIMSILFRAKPSEVKFIIIDPKVVEFGVYNGIPHLLQPVVTDARLASNTLKWAVAEMSDRYKKFADMNVRDLKGYNEKLDTIKYQQGEEKPEKLPQIVIIIDELADLMMAAAKEVEESICRLAQLARAAGIHLVIATQRPSVDVVTGLIKANIPSRVALLVASGTDSRTIIDMNGAEKLLGNGDMLFYPSGYVKPVRLQGAFVSDAEVQKVVNYLSTEGGQAEYDKSISEYVSSVPQQQNISGRDDNSGNDEYFEEAGRFVIEKDKASTSMLQRMFKIGFNRAGRIMDQLCQAGVVGEEEGTKPRKVLMTMVEFEEYMKNI